MNKNSTRKGTEKKIVELINISELFYRNCQSDLCVNLLTSISFCFCIHFN